MKKAAAILLLLLCFQGWGQMHRSITGTVVEEETGSPIIQAGVLLLSVKDSTVLEGVVTNAEGRFYVPALPGDYILKFSCLGFSTLTRNIHQTVSQQGLEIGRVPLSRTTLGLDAAVVQETAPPVTVKEDTVIYNAAAFRVPEDAALEELIRKIPGMELDDNGGVTLNGKQVKQLRVNGKRYFGDNVKAGIKNIPADIVENIQAYDAPSDFSRISGIDDGEEEPVLDITVKKSRMGKWNNSASLGGGTSWRYAGRLNSNKIDKSSQQTALVNVRNLPPSASLNNTSRNQVGSGASGDANRGEAGYTFSRENDRLSMSGSAHASIIDRSTVSSGRSETLNASSSSFSASKGIRRTLTPDFNGDFTLEWKRDKYLTVHAKASLKYNNNMTAGITDGRTFREDPFGTEVDPSGYLAFDIPDDPFTATRVNGTHNATASATSKVTASANATVTKRSQKQRGRSISFNLSVQYNGNDADRYGCYRTRYYRISSNPDSLLVRSNYVTDDNLSLQVSPQVSVNIPVVGKWNFQGTFRTDISHYTQDKDYFDIDAVDPGWELPTESALPRRWKDSLPRGYRDGFYDLFSAQGSYDRFTFSTLLNVSRYTKKVSLVAGVAFRPQIAILHYDGETFRRTTFNAAPNVVFKYRIAPKKQLEFFYRSWLGSPSVASMLPVTNGTNPLYVSVGNPRLRSPFSHRITLSYNASNLARRSSFVGNAQFQYTFDSVSSSTVYDEASGVRTTTPQNIDGNWKASGSTVYNKTFPDNRFSIMNHLGAEYQHNVTFLYDKSQRKDQTNVTGRMMIKERFEGSFRGRFVEVVLSAGADYTDERSRLRPSMNQRPVNWLAGISLEASLPWKVRLESDFTTSFQRGWTYGSLNRNYYIWNAELSKSFLKGRFHVRLGWYDILRSQENLVSTFGQSVRSITFYNGVTGYGFLRLLYKF